VSKIVVIAHKIKAFTIRFEGLGNIVKPEINQVMKTISYSLQQIMFDAVTEESILPELLQVGKRDSIGVGE
jgi:hypothetical protein